jgi:hypothetical protein
MTRWERWSPLAGVGAVVLWVVGLLMSEAPTTQTKQTDAHILSIYQQHTNSILLGSWLFMLGGVLFIWFMGAFRTRLAEAEGGPRTFSTIAFAGGVASAIFAIGTVGGPMAVAINKNDVSAATAGALTYLGDAFFVGAELTMIVLWAAAALLALKTDVLPKWWAAVMIVGAVGLVIGPIGWAVLIIGVPIWTLVTTYLIVRAPRVEAVATPATG